MELVMPCRNQLSTINLQFYEKLQTVRFGDRLRTRLLRVFGQRFSRGGGKVAINIEEETLALQIGETHRLTVSVSPENATIVYSSSDEAIATVADDGTVTAIALGKATITAQAGKVSNRCEITVTDGSQPETTVTLEPESLTLNVGETGQLTATVTPESDTPIIWSSSDDAIATVADDGTVTAVSPGSAVISASVGDARGDCTVTVQQKTPEEPADPAQIGDYYYSDGTYSPELDPEKTPIGIVFWVGNPTQDDATLAAEHPGCTHGLVVSLTEKTQCCWQSACKTYGSTVNAWIVANAPEYDEILQSGAIIGDTNDLINRIMGYNNTKAIEAFNAAPENSGWPVEIVQQAADYRSEVPAPANSSDWYLPSIKELTLICSGEKQVIPGGMGTENRDLLNRKLEAIDGAQPIQTALGSGASFHQTSTESNETQYWCMATHEGVVANSSKDFGASTGRFVLAF